jgi:bifunctional UDP-N-acetylglucosamine 2-epimerase / N-acetylmannosamine kinase
MIKRKICVVITARPSYARVKTALHAINNHPDLELQLILAGSALLDRYGDASKVVEADGFKVIEKIYNVLEGEAPGIMAKITGLAIMELSTTFQNVKPDLVVTIADRFETIATSIAASYQNIPLAHIQGGEVTGNIDEKVRHANTKLADIHLVASEGARQRVIRLGENERYVINTGCPSMDLAKEVLENSSFDFNPITKYGGVGSEIKWHNGYIVVMQHPVTTELEDTKKDIEATLNAIYELNIPTFWFWPNVDAGSDSLSKGIRAFREKHQAENIHFFKNMEPGDFLKLIKNSKCLIGNSSVGIRESAFLGIPVVNIGTRQHGRQRAKSVIDCNYDKDKIKSSVNAQLKHGHYEPEFIYGNGFAGQKIADILATIDLTYHKTITY